MRVIGTAGHVDHGKSTLVEAITGTHPDRLKEEREREMTIDLGFAYTTLPDGEEVAFVDVPGHRDFIENMLAGVGGIDAALFVVAADEGVMPQTREHLAILDLLEIPAGVVALTKTDLVDDPEWLDLVREEVRQVLQGTRLEGAPFVPVSARTGEGVRAVEEALAAVLRERPPRPDRERPRLPVDRVFSVAGFGTVVTGTLTDGALRVGDEVEILPRGLRSRVRGLQTHRRSVEQALPGSRTAINLIGVSVDDLGRGDVIVHPGTDRPTRRLDVAFRLLPDVSKPLKHNMEVKLFLGTAEVVTRVRLLGRETLPPGETGLLQLEPAHPVVARRGDRFILRRPSPGETLGGGQVLDPFPARRYKRFAEATLARLQALTQATPEELLRQALNEAGLVQLSTLIATTGLSHDEALSAAQTLADAGEMVSLSGVLGVNAWLVDTSHLNRLRDRALGWVSRYHRENPLRLGMPREELKSRLRLPSAAFQALMAHLEAQGRLKANGHRVALPDHRVRFTGQQQRQVDALWRAFAAQPTSPPTAKSCREQVGDEVFQALIELGELVPVSPEVIFRREDYERLRADVVAWLRERGTITVADLRDRWRTSRRYALAFLEHLDAIGVTVREGDRRRLR